jgi:hypothetical protein
MDRFCERGLVRIGERAVEDRRTGSRGLDDLAPGLRLWFLACWL